MRVKSQWFKSATPKSATEIAGAAAFIVFRIAQNSLKNMRQARFELPAGATLVPRPPYRQRGSRLRIVRLLPSGLAKRPHLLCSMYRSSFVPFLRSVNFVSLPSTVAT